VAPGRPRGSRSRRVSLPGVAELLRPVGRGPAFEAQRQALLALGGTIPLQPSASEQAPPASGRERHAQKITVYLSGGELLDLERARLTLRALGITVDRGRIVREAIAVLLADLDAEGDRSLVARRLCEGFPGGSAGVVPPRGHSEGISSE
jgi:hypothetical protein